MCDTLGELSEGLRRYAAGFAAPLLSAADAQRVVEAAAAIEGIAATIKALAAARVSEAGGGAVGVNVRRPITWPG